jgi:RND family efflux transporter MFP subunit
MKSKIYLGVFVVSMTLLLAACSATTDNDKKAKLEKLRTEQNRLSSEIKKLETELAKENPSKETVKAKDVSVTDLAPRVFNHYIQTQGSIYSKDNILVSAKSAGIITQVFVVEGDLVSKGQTLAQVDNSLLQRSVEEVKSGLELAKTVFERQKNLWDQKIGTEVQYLQAKNNKESLEKRLATLSEQVDMSRIKSPIDGTVDEVRLRVGENIAPGIPALRVVSSHNLRVKASLSESFVATVKKGNLAHVSFPDLKKEMDAKVTFVGRTIDPLSRTFDVEIDLPSQTDLRPNMTAVIKVIFKSASNALVVPVNIIQSINNQSVLYVAETTGDKTVARRKVVEIDGVYDNQAQVIKGLSPGDRVITVGYQGLNDGDLIKI